MSALVARVSSGRRANAFNALVSPVITAASSGSLTLSVAADFTLTVDGVNFESGAVVRWNGADRATTFVSPTRLTATILAVDAARAGTAAVTVFNPVAGVVSNAQAFTVNLTPLSGSSSGCFIATAAYGSAMAEDVRYLRAFRDQYLLTSTIGRWFVRQYYRFSPPLAEGIRARQRLRAIVRAALRPLVALSKWAVDATVLERQTADRS